MLKRNDDYGTDVQARTLLMSRTFSTSAQRVFDAWTKPEEFSKWMGPEGTKVQGCEIELKPGGSFKVALTSDNGDHVATGLYEEIAPGERLVFTWAWTYPEGRGHVTAITIELSESDGETVMNMHQALFADAEHCEQHRHGWDGSFQKLAKAL